MSFEAIRNLYPQVTNFDEKYGYFDVDGKEVEIDSALVDKEVKRLEEEYDAQEYSRKREAEYPSIPDQLDEIYHNGIDSWKAVIKKTKDKYPKG